jgi:hypothetical protein
MSSLEGKKLRKTTSSRDILGKITRPAPLPPTEGDGESRPVSEIEIGGGVETWRASLMSKVDEAEEKCMSSLVREVDDADDSYRGCSWTCSSCVGTSRGSEEYVHKLPPLHGTKLTP